MEKSPGSEKFGFAMCRWLMRGANAMCRCDGEGEVRCVDAMEKAKCDVAWTIDLRENESSIFDRGFTSAANILIGKEVAGTGEKPKCRWANGPMY